MCVKINVLYVQCTVYILHIYAHSAISPFLPLNCVFTLAGPMHFAHISKITTRQTRSVCKCCEQR